MVKNKRKASVLNENVIENENEIWDTIDKLIEPVNNVYSQNLEILNQIVEKWKTGNTEWMELNNSDHRCNLSTDENEETTLKKDKSAIIIYKELQPKKQCEIIQIKADVYDLENNNIHICIENLCTYEKNDPIYHKKKIETIENIYICKHSGLVHFCDTFCKPEDTTLNAEYTYVCKYSGRMTKDIKTVDKFWTKESKGEKDIVTNPFMIGTKKKYGEDFTDLETLVYKCGSSNIKENGSSKKRRKEMQSLKKVYLMEAIMKLSNYFSEERFEADKQIEMNLVKEIMINFKKYVNKHIQKMKPLIVADLFQICQVMRARKNPLYDLTGISETMRVEMVLHYAKQCLALWTIIRTKTSIGKSKPSLFPWSEFIDSALSVLESGIVISDRNYPVHSTIIEQDKFLPLLSHNSPYLKNKQIKKSKKNNVTKITTRICRAIIEAVINENVDPEELLLHSIDIEQIPEDIFLKLRGKQREKKHK